MWAQCCMLQAQLPHTLPGWYGGGAISAEAGRLHAHQLMRVHVPGPSLQGA